MLIVSRRAESDWRIMARTDKSIPHLRISAKAKKQVGRNQITVVYTINRLSIFRLRFVNCPSIQGESRQNVRYTSEVGKAS